MLDSGGAAVEEQEAAEEPGPPGGPGPPGRPPPGGEGPVGVVLAAAIRRHVAADLAAAAAAAAGSAALQLPEPQPVGLVQQLREPGRAGPGQEGHGGLRGTVQDMQRHVGRRQKPGPEQTGSVRSQKL